MAESPELTSYVVADCPVCGGSNFRGLRTPGHPIGEAVFAPCLDQFRLCRCSCGLELLSPRPSARLLAQFYGSKIYDCHKPDCSISADRKAQGFLDLLASVGPHSDQKRLLDFGCGGGYLLVHALKAGWDAIGFDVGREAIETCRKNRLPATDSLDELRQGSFDVIILNHVFEHVEEPGGLLEFLKGLLRPRGKLVIEVPNVHSLRALLALPVFSRYLHFDERHRAFPIHLWYFSSRTLPVLLHKHGLNAILITTSGLGIDELIIRGESRERPSQIKSNKAPSTHGVTRPRSLLGPLKSAIKAALFGAKLGENLIVVAEQG